MADVSIPHTLSPGTREDVTKVQANFESLRDSINDKFPVVESDVASPSTGLWRTIHTWSGVLPLDAPMVLGGYPMTEGVQLESGSTLGPSESLALAYLVAADHSVASLSSKARLAAQVSCNGTAPGCNMQVSLYSSTAFSGAADALGFTGSVVATASLPAVTANSTTSARSSEIAFPADGPYYVVVGLETPGVANNAVLMVNAQVQVRNV